MTRLSDWEFDGTERWFLWGMPLSGKSSLGKKIRSRLPFPVFDLDKEIESRSGRSIPDIFEREGEAGFRELEADILRNIVRENEAFLLICGGGTPCFSDNASLMNREGRTVFLDVSLEEILARAARATEERPLLAGIDGGERLKKMAEVRRMFYEQAHLAAFSEKEILDCFLRWFSRS